VTEAESYAREREERRGLEQRAATLIASMLVTIGLAASSGSAVAGAGGAAKVCLIAAVIVLALGVLLAVVALVARSGPGHALGSFRITRSATLVARSTQSKSTFSGTSVGQW
jgi:hypothetical protein